MSYPIEPWMKEARQAAYANKYGTLTLAELETRVRGIRAQFANAPAIYAACSVCRATVTLPATKCARHA